MAPTQGEFHLWAAFWRHISLGAWKGGTLAYIGHDIDEHYLDGYLHLSPSVCSSLGVCCGMKRE